MTTVQDRFCEMNLAWFDPARMETDSETLVARLAPLYAGVEGDYGLILDVGMLMDFVTRWEGTLDQRLAVGTSRLGAWQQATYDDFRQLVLAIKAAAERHGLPRFTVGIMLMSRGGSRNPEAGKVYEAFISEWCTRHPEIFLEHLIPNIDVTARLQGDTHRYAAYAEGIPDGMPFTTFFGAQWGLFSRAVGLDAILVRDGWLGTMVYSRKSQYGETGPTDPAEALRWTEGCKALYRELKQGNPEALVMGYSSAATAIGEWRVGGIDLEAVIADGCLDIWIDQTWGGAWQDWWSWETIGWTMQLAYLTQHRLIVERGNQHRTTPCRHYHLIETWDAWEPWDTLHQVPGKLRWAMWAFSHAAAQMPEGLTTTNGSYLSWVDNRRREIWSETDVAFLVDNLNAALDNAQGMETVYGPAMVYNRPGMEKLQQTHPGENVSEWLDEQTGLLMKWGLPVLQAIDLERVTADTLPAGGVVQAVGPMTAADTMHLSALAQDGVPLILAGRADVVDPALLALAGVRPEGNAHPAGFADVTLAAVSVDLPTWQRIYHPPVQPITTREADTLVAIAETPLLTQRHGMPVWYWQPQDWYDPSDPVMRRCKLGSVAPYALLARQVNAASPAAITIAPVAYDAPVTVHAWKSRGAVYLLLGNLETGVCGDARTPRTVTVTLSPALLGLPDANYVLRDVDTGDEVAPLSLDAMTWTISVAPESSRVLGLVPMTEEG